MIFKTDSRTTDEKIERYRDYIIVKIDCFYKLFPQSLHNYFFNHKLLYFLNQIDK